MSDEQSQTGVTREELRGAIHAMFVLQLYFAGSNLYSRVQVDDDFETRKGFMHVQGIAAGKVNGTLDDIGNAFPQIGWLVDELRRDLEVWCEQLPTSSSRRPPPDEKREPAKVRLLRPVRGEGEDAPEAG
jgi:hypothetical protein